MSEADRQWPDNIVGGDICYGRAYNYDGFYLADASHGIPTIGSVQDGGSLPHMRGQRVQVFNYPGQTEAIAKQLVHRWNRHVGLVGALENLFIHVGMGWELEDVLKDAEAALKAARAA